MTSAVALGDGLRLRSRRVRSSRSHRLSLWASIVVIAIAAGAGFIGVQTRTPPPSAVNVNVVDAATLDQQRFASELRPIRGEVQQSIAETGLLVASFQSGSISKAELQRRLTAVLADYRDAARQVDALNPPADMRPTVQGYRDLLGALTQSGTELSKAYDDGDEGRVSIALAHSLQATVQLHDLGDVDVDVNVGAKRP